MLVMVEAAALAATPAMLRVARQLAAVLSVER
jgi:hypothetical protein